MLLKVIEIKTALLWLPSVPNHSGWDSVYINLLIVVITESWFGINLIVYFQWFTLDSVWPPHWLFADLLYCTRTFQVENTLVLCISCISDKPISFLSFIFSVDGLKSWKWSHAGLCEAMETNEGKVLGKLKIAYPGHPFWQHSPRQSMIERYLRRRSFFLSPDQNNS